MRGWAIALRIAVLAIPLAVRAGSLPGDPVAGEPFMLYGSVSFNTGDGPTYSGHETYCNIAASATTVGDQGISIFLGITKPTTPYTAIHFTWACPFTALVPGQPAGTYAASFKFPSDIGGSVLRKKLSATSVTVGPAVLSATPRYRGLDGNWFDPAQPGWGLNVVQGDSGALFAALLTYYPADGAPVATTYGASPVWFVMPEGRWTTPDTFRGLLYLASGPVVGANWGLGGVKMAPAGLIQITFSAPDTASLEATIVWAGGNVDATTMGPPQGTTLRRFLF